jgi:hypothetical protein
MRWKLPWIIALLAMPGPLAWFVCPRQAGPRLGISWENYERVEVGMTAKEVTAILGPDGYYAKRPILFVKEGMMFRRCWITDDVIITIEVFPCGAIEWSQFVK